MTRAVGRLVMSSKEDIEMFRDRLVEVFMLFSNCQLQMARGVREDVCLQAALDQCHAVARPPFVHAEEE